MSYDIDAVDPAHAPATGTVVRGGLNYREVTGFRAFTVRGRHSIDEEGRARVSAKYVLELPSG